MTVNELFRICNDKINYKFICLTNPALVSEKTRPQEIWFNKIIKIEMINKIFNIYISEEINKDTYNSNTLKIKFYDIMDLLNDKACIFTSAEYYKNKKEFIDALYIRDDNYIEIY